MFMAIRIYSAHVALSLVIRVQCILMFCVLILWASAATEAQEFFEKNYAREMVESSQGSHPAFGPAAGSAKNARKIKPYEEYMAERREQKEAQLAEQIKNKEAKKKKANPEASVGSFVQNASPDSSSVPVAESNENTPGEASATSLPFEPLDAEAQGGATLDIILSTSPAEHFFSELRRIVEVSRIKGVTLGDVYAVGKPPLVPEFVEALKEFHKTKKNIKFEMSPPNDLKVEYSPVWIVTVAGKKLVFEGEFRANEIFITNKNR